MKYILAISLLVLFTSLDTDACGPYYPESPKDIRMFRSCSPELEEQWQDGCRFQDYEKYENCVLWQKLTSASIPLNDIEKLVYDSKLKDIKELDKGPLSENGFAQWLSSNKHKEDLDYILVAKEIEEIREYMTDPWYYPYDGDEEHHKLDELMKKCMGYKGKRHAERYALQLVRLYFAKKDFQSCIQLWESSANAMPQNIITDMIASYVGGAYFRKGNRDKAIQLFTRSQDIGSLINLKAWNDTEEKSEYKDVRVMRLEYIFNRFPDSPLLNVKLQQYIRKLEFFVYDIKIPDEEHVFYEELKRFAKNAISSKKCHQKGMWLYSLAYLYHLDNRRNEALYWLNRAENAEASPLIKESIKAFRFLMDATYANNSPSYRTKLLENLRWLDQRMEHGAKPDPENGWQYDNKMNISFYYWQDVTRKVILGNICHNIGNTTLALQLANYATNRIYQLDPMFEIYHHGCIDSEDSESYTITIPFDEYRQSSTDVNWFDYSNQFFEWINSVSAAEAAKYANRIAKPTTELDKFLNERSYVNADYIYDIVGTLYLREMNYDKAVEWLSKVSKAYQNRTNIAKEGYFKLDPFQYQFDKKQYISNPDDYKLRFAQEMSQLEKMISSDAEPNRKANAKIRYAIGLRNSFGRCWYLTQYGYSISSVHDDDYSNRECYSSINREGFAQNKFAQIAYKQVDNLMDQAISEFTDPEQAAQAQLDMMNYNTLMSKYPGTKVAEFVQSRCDNYFDYHLHKK